MGLNIEHLSFRYGQDIVLRNISLQMESSLIAIIGPNGAGKSTLMKCVGGILKPGGNIFFNGREVNSMYREFYRDELSYLPQTMGNHSRITVFEATLLGLIHSLSLRVSDEQLGKVMEVLEELNLAQLSKKYLNQLSGGQQQMVSIAQAIVKDPQILLLDEPLTGLDIHHQFEVLELISKLTRDKKMITLFAMHDLNLAARYSDRMIVIDDGSVYADDRPEKMLTKEMIRDVYHIQAEISLENNIPYVLPIGLCDNQ